MSATSSYHTDALARLDRLPRWPWGRKVIVLIGGSSFFAFYDVIVIGAVLPVIATQFGLDLATVSIAVTAGLVGVVVGSIGDGFIATRFGRRTAFQIAMVMFSIGMLLSAFSPNLTMLVIARIIAGAGIGADIDMMVTYTSEISPESMRGRITSLSVICGFLGMVVVPILARVAIEVSWGWRALFVLGGLGGIVLTIARRNLPPSPRYLISRGRADEAEAVVAEAEKRVGVTDLLPVEVEDTGPLISERAAFGKYWPWVLLFVVAWVFYYFGNYGWLAVAPSLFTQAGFSLASSLNFLIVGNLGLVFGAALSYFLTEREERKYLLQGTLVVWGASLAAIGLVGDANVIMVGGFIAATTIGLAVPVFYTLTAEQFPAALRPVAVATTDGIGHLGGAVAPLILIPLGFRNGFIAMAVAGFVTAILLIPSRRTHGRSLEELTG